MATSRDENATDEGHEDDRSAHVDEPPASGAPAEPGGEQEHEPVDAPPASDGPVEPGTS